MLVALISNYLVVGVQSSDHPTVPLSEQFVAALSPTDVTNVSPQPQVGWIATPAAGGGWTFAPPPAAPPPPVTPATAYAAFIAGGAAVTSAGTPALNGTYAIDATAQAKITSVASFVQTYSEFPNGSAANMAWVLANGSTVEFPTTASFLAFAKAIGQLVYAADIALASGSTAIPSNAVSIP